MMKIRSTYNGELKHEYIYSIENIITRMNGICSIHEKIINDLCIPDNFLISLGYDNEKFLNGTLDSYDLILKVPYECISHNGNIYVSEFKEYKIAKDIKFAVNPYSLINYINNNEIPLIENSIYEFPYYSLEIDRIKDFGNVIKFISNNICELIKNNIQSIISNSFEAIVEFQFYDDPLYPEYFTMNYFGDIIKLKQKDFCVYGGFSNLEER